MPKIVAKSVLLLAVALYGTVASAAGLEGVFTTSRAKTAEPDFLHPDVAFRLVGRADGPDRVRLGFEVHPGYYLYRSRLKVVTTAPQATLGNLSLPAGESKTDDYFGRQEVYHSSFEATMGVSRPAGAAMQIPLKVTYQGCAEAGLCYPPITKTLNIDLPAGTGGGGSGFVSEQDKLANLIRTGNLALMLAMFFGAGLLLAFTPCVLPMVPILSGIIAGHGPRVTTRRAFALSLTYVLGMSVTYTVAGIAFGAAGQQAQAVFQKPWIVIVFAGLFVLLALSMFGLFTIQMPAAVQTRLASLSNRQSAGTFGGVAVMGGLSALIVTTCVAPPLVATLAVIGQSGALARGGAALFVMSLGMGAPLLVVGASAGKLLPKAGAWMDTVKLLFGVLMLGVAAWMLARIVPERSVLLLWAVPAFAAAVVFWRALIKSPSVRWISRTAAVAASLYGVALVAGAVLGATDPLAPVALHSRPSSSLQFHAIKSVDDLRREVADASKAGKPVMLDFYADWCVSCKEMERDTFSDPAVEAALTHTHLLRADVTANDDQDQALLRHFGIFGPPTIAFYGRNGEERRNFRVVGFMKPEQFAAVTRQAQE
jgi:thiol:disulfide interchange protein DsbD